MQKLKEVTDNRTYRIMVMSKAHTHCRYCQKTVGNFYARCGIPIHGKHGSGKYVWSHKWREFKTWKHNRKTQWK